MRNRRLIGSCLAAALAACTGDQAQEPPGARQPLGLFTTLPVYWGEHASLSATLQAQEQPGWVRRQLEETYRLEPLDTLSNGALDSLDLLVMAQPRALSPAENVALDEWVRQGGHLLLLADPFLTRHSEFGLGDARRPQDVVLLSPILARWGLELLFDPAQGDAQRTEDAFGAAYPVRLAGRFQGIPTEAPADCTLSQTGLAARCTIGAGTVLAIADAALLDGEEPGAIAAEALDAATGQAFVR